MYVFAMIAAALCVAGAVLWLVILYNQIVNLRHSFAEETLHFQEIQATNAELKDVALRLFDDENLKGFAEERGLIQDKKPQYLLASQQWASVSR